ncbi:unnamed protein product [Clavelina lepadiformis]|uniref:GB1/RHD3-type G domain-containing protein n=1 Tax=Clavelina lepadiformis TaxID=159417 RepID=A0ABP0GLB7_CLALP
MSAFDFFVKKGFSFLKLVTRKFDEQGKAEPLLTPTTNGYEMDKVLLMNLVEREEVKNNPVVIISVAGAKREGKSFLLSLLVKYLESDMDEKWMDDEESPIPQHFPWRSGREANTRGIWVWNKPYLIEGSDGRKMAVILLDTEGSFSKTGKKNDSNIFAFSTLLSCVQIYNMKDELNEQKLESLAIFTSYAEEAGNKDYSGHIFQTLMLLVRDWNDNRYKCGIEGGTKYMKDELNDYDGDDEDMIAVREKIFQAFKQVKCTLLPQPGPIIAGFGTSDRKDTKTLLIKDISPTMRIHLRRFFHHLLDECTEAKHIGGSIVKGEEILNFSTKLFDLLQNDQILNATSAMRGIDIAKAQTLIQQLQQDYDDNMKKVSESYCSEPELMEEHKKNLDEAHRKYDDGFSTVYDDHKNTFRTQLTEAIDMLFNKHNQTRITKENEIRSKYENLMETSLEEYKKLLKSNNSVAETSTLFYFLNNDLKTDAFYDEYENALKGKMEEAKNQMKSLQLLSEGQKIALESYKADMENKIKKDSPTMATLENLHKEYAKKAKKLLMSKYTTENTSQSDKEKQKNELNKELAKEYKTFKDRLEKNEKKFKTYVDSVKNDYLEYMDMVTRNVYLHHEDLRTVHDKFINMMKRELEKLRSVKNMKEVERKNLIQFMKSILEEEKQKIFTNMEQRKGEIRELSNKEVMNKIKKIIFKFDEGVWDQNWFMYQIRRTFCGYE